MADIRFVQNGCSDPLDEATGGAGVNSTDMAQKLRTETNGLSSTERDELFKEGMALINPARMTERELLMRIHSLLTAQRPASGGWQPIEAASMDMTIVVVFTSDSEVLTAFREIGQWYSVREGLKLTGQPTHWMALPEPPK